MVNYTTFPSTSFIFQLFIANSDASTIAKNVLEQPIQARYVRINPVGYRRHMSMRIEIIGCDIPNNSSNSLNVSYCYFGDHFSGYQLTNVR